MRASLPAAFKAGRVDFVVVASPTLCESLDVDRPPSLVVHWDFERLAAELLRALRGERSQAAFARRLKYKSNIIYSWESERAFPTAARALWAAERVGVDVRAAVASFLRQEPAWYELYGPGEPAGVAALLNDVRGRLPVVDLAREADRSRFAVARWLKGTAEPRLPDFLRLIEASTLRLLDFVALLADPTKLPSVSDRWVQLEAARHSAFEQPWTQAVMRCLELQSYRRHVEHPDGWIAKQLGIDPRAESEALALLVQSGQVQVRDGKYVPSAAPNTVDTRRAPEVARRLRVFWSQVAADRLEKGGEGLFAYNVFSVSNADLQKLREMHKAYYQEVRAIIAHSEPVDRVALMNLQLLPLTRA